MNAIVIPWRARQCGQHPPEGPITGKVGKAGKVYSLISMRSSDFQKDGFGNYVPAGAGRSKHSLHSPLSRVAGSMTGGAAASRRAGVPIEAEVCECGHDLSAGRVG
jgi:hypothetical protein